ncbi:hypothetical protein TeGR_g11976, partial [Tetraparma gracilis]
MLSTQKLSLPAPSVSFNWVYRSTTSGHAPPSSMSSFISTVTPASALPPVHDAFVQELLGSLISPHIASMSCSLLLSDGPFGTCDVEMAASCLAMESGDDENAVARTKQSATKLLSKISDKISSSMPSSSARIALSGRESSDSAGYFSFGRQSHRASPPSSPSSPSSPSPKPPASPLPKRAAESLLNRLAISLVRKVCSEFARYAEVDAAYIKEFTTVAIPTACPESSAERKLVRTALESDGDGSTASATGSDWTRIRGTVTRSVEVYERPDAANKSVWGKAKGEVDAPADEVVAWLWRFMGYERLLEHFTKHENRLRFEVDVPDSHSKLMCAVHSLPGGFDDRLFAVWWTWTLDPSSNSFILAFTPMLECPAYDAAKSYANNVIDNCPDARKAVKGGTRGFWRITPLAPTVSSFTLVQMGTVGGMIPLWVTNYKVLAALKSATNLKHKHERSDEDVTVDVPPLSAASFVYAVSRSKVAHSVAKGDKAYLVLRQPSPYEMTCALVTPLPFPLTDREFIYDNVIAADSPTSFVVAMQSCDDVKVDYGANLSPVRGFVRILFRIQPVDAAPNQCKVSVLQFLDPASSNFIPRKVVHGRLIENLHIEDLRAKFQRDSEIDKASNDATADMIIKNEDPCSVEESAFVKNVRQELFDLDSAVMDDLESPDHLVRMGIVLGRTNFGAGSGISVASTVVDATVAQCAAIGINIMTREATLRTHLVNGSPERLVYPRTPHTQIYRRLIELPIPGITPREFVSQQTWEWENEKTLHVVYNDAEIPEHPELTSKFARGSVQVLQTYDWLDPVNGVPQTRVTWLQRANFRVLISAPERLMRKSVAKRLQWLVTMRKKFDHSEDLDRAKRRALESAAVQPQVYTKEDDEIINSGLKQFEIFGSEARNRSTIKGLSPTVTNEECLAYIWHLCARCRWGDQDLERTVLEEKSDHHQTVYQCKKHINVGGIKYHSRDIVMQQVWKLVDPKTYVIAGRPTSHPLRPARERASTRISRFSSRRNSTERFRDRIRSQHADPNEYHVRGIGFSTVQITETSPGVCRFVAVTHLDFGGFMPKILVNWAMRSTVHSALRAQLYLQGQRRLEDFDDSAGKAFAELLMVPVKQEKHLHKGETFGGVRMHEVFSTYRGAREIKERWEWFEDMMACVVCNKLQLGVSMESKLCNVKKMDGRTMGSGLAQCLALSLTSQTAVDEWIFRYPALQELEKEAEWFRATMDTVAQRLLSEVGWGAKLRLYGGASLSIMDMLSDVNV